MPRPGGKRSSVASCGSTSPGSARTASALPVGSRPTSSTPATPSTRPGPRSSGTRCEIRGPELLNGYPLEGLGVAVTGLLPNLSVPLAHELLEVPLLPRLGDLALVLLQRLDLEVERGGDVDQVVARGPEGDPHLLDDVRFQAFLEQAAKSAGVAGVGLNSGKVSFSEHNTLKATADDV